MSVTSAKSGATGISLALDNNYMEPIATTLVGSGGASVVTFNDIPQGYKHLQIRLSANQQTNNNMLNIRVNGDESGTTYSIHSINGSGSSVGANSAAPVQYIRMARSLGISNTANIYTVGIIDILDYANTNKYKTFRMFSGLDRNGSGSIDFESGLWMNMDAINKLDLFSTYSFTQYSRFSLYGIKG